MPCRWMRNSPCASLSLGRRYKAPRTLLRRLAVLLAPVVILGCRTTQQLRTATVQESVLECPRAPVLRIAESMRPLRAARDSSMTQARMRWAIADMLAALNSRDPADIAVRYDWGGGAGDRQQVLANVRSPGTFTSLEPDGGADWWSDAPGSINQNVCVSLVMQSNNAGGVRTRNRLVLRASAMDDGRTVWLSRLSITPLGS